MNNKYPQMTQIYADNVIRICGKKIGMKKLINLGVNKLQYKRFIFNLRSSVQSADKKKI